MTAAMNLLEDPVVHMTAVRHSPSPGRATTGVIEDLLIHDLDLALKLMNGHELRTAKATVTPPESQLVEIAEVSIVGAHSQIAHLSASRWGQRKVRQWSISTDSKLIEVDLLQQTVVAFENIDQTVGTGGGSSYRTRTVIEYPFIARGGEPLGLQLSHFAKLIEGEESLDKEIHSIERTHQVLNDILFDA
jgi:predicted dehydrogenase